LLSYTAAPADALAGCPALSPSACFAGDACGCFVAIDKSPEDKYFGFYYRPDVNRILFSFAPSTGEAPCCYDTIVSESRIASYIGMAKGELPPRHYFGAGNALARDMLREAFVTPEFERALRPVIAVEAFDAGPDLSPEEDTGRDVIAAEP
jgi:hypothetical protein